ncbi:M24 family metallopeptidase [Paraburkholderia sp. A1RI-2L]|uniref:M24 family metallopeptidase n=1 Tax=Paraburkholderia sp. A1RI-2L TaxID=3028367 RepID=UPI003B7EA190
MSNTEHLDAADTLCGYRKVQHAARRTLDEIVHFIAPGVSEIDLVRKCDELQRAAGVDDYWYRALPALVLAGEHTCLAISREAYVPESAPLKHHDVLTIDLNPAMNGYCGDLARTYFIEDGQVRRAPHRDEEFLAGAHAQASLHALLRRVATPDLRFDELYGMVKDAADRLECELLDYLGHSMQANMSALDFIAPKVTHTLGEVGLFTLEPQLRVKGGRHGFKHENIYFFAGGVLHEL